MVYEETAPFSWGSFILNPYLNGYWGRYNWVQSPSRKQQNYFYLGHSANIFRGLHLCKLNHIILLLSSYIIIITNIISFIRIALIYYSSAL